jgi:hypothetical protein
MRERNPPLEMNPLFPNGVHFKRFVETQKNTGNRKSGEFKKTVQ